MAAAPCANGAQQRKRPREQGGDAIGPLTAQHINDLPDALLATVWAHLPLERNKVENRHALALVCRRWRAALAGEAAAPLWASVQASLLLDPMRRASFPLHGMYSWFARHAASIASLTLEVNSGEAWPPVHAVLGATGSGLTSLRIFSDSDEPCFEPKGSAPWLGLLPRLSSLELEGVTDTTVESAHFPPGLTHVGLSGCGLDGLYRVPAALRALRALRSLSLQFMEPGADLSGLVALTTLQRVDLSSCALRAVPAELAALPQLTALTLNNNEQLGGEGNFDYVAALAQLARLEVLEMRDCALKAIPASVVALTSLRTLLLGYNDFTAAVVIPPGPYLARLELLAMSDCIPDPAPTADLIVRPLAAATALQVLRINRNWGLALSDLGVRALLKGKPRFRKLEYSEDMAPTLDLAALKARYPRVTFKVVD